MKIKFIYIILIINLFTLILISCSSNDYNAVMYSKSNDLLLTTFLDDNRVRGVYYKNPKYIDNETNSDNEYIYDETSPKDRIITIESDDLYKTIFVDNTLNVDFNKNIIYIYIFADTYPNRNYLIKNVKLDNEKLIIDYKLEGSNKKDSTIPYQRCLIVVMNKTNASYISFNKIL